MNELLKTVLSLSLSGSLLILLLFLCRPLLRNRVSRQWQYYIWLIVIARLLLPLAPEANLMGALFREAERHTAQEAPLPGPYPAFTPEPSAPEGGAEGGRPDAAPSGAAPAPEMETPALPYLWLVWLGGALLLLIRKITIYQSFGRFVRAGREEVSDPALLDRLAQTGAELGVARPVELWVNRQVSSPLLLGFFRPRVVLPSADLVEADFEYTLRHELTHYKRRDMFYKWLVQLAVCLHWFNPLVWLMGREIGRACELSCDEAVIAALDPAGRRAYGGTLLRAMEAGGSCQNSTASVTLTEGAALLRERLEAIMNFKKSSKLAIALSLVLTVMLTMGAAAAGAYPGPAAAAPPERKTAQKAQALSCSFEGTVFRYGGTEYDLSQRSGALTSITGCAPVGECIVIEGHAGPKNSLYFIFNTKTRAIEKELAGSHLIWRDNDISTAVYAFWAEIRDYSGNVLGECDLGEQDVIYSLSFDGNEAVVLALTPEMEEKTFRFPVNASSSLAAQAERYYEAESLPLFKAVFPRLGEAGQRAWLERIYADGDAAFFSVAADGLDPDSPLLAEAAEWAYRDGDMAFFSILANNYMGGEELEAWLDRALEDGDFAFQSMLFSALDRDWELEEKKAELDKQRREEYAAHDITVDGKSYYYQGRLVNIFLDRQPNAAFYCLDMNPLGTVNVKVIRNPEGGIESAGYMTEAEVQELFGDMYGPDDE